MNSLAPNEIHVKLSNNKVTAFDASKIAVALTKAFLAVEGGLNFAISPTVTGMVNLLISDVTIRDVFEIVLTTSEPATDSVSFTTDNPARIAIDLPGPDVIVMAFTAGDRRGGAPGRRGDQLLALSVAGAAAGPGAGPGPEGECLTIPLR